MSFLCQSWSGLTNKSISSQAMLSRDNEMIGFFFFFPVFYFLKGMSFFCWSWSGLTNKFVSSHEMLSFDSCPTGGRDSNHWSSPHEPTKVSPKPSHCQLPWIGGFEPHRSTRVLTRFFLLFLLEPQG